jgi:hypothetical protein
MARDALSLITSAVLLLTAIPPASAAPPEERDGKLATLLAVQRALQEGRDHLQRGNYQAAVYVLESQVARIDGNREYLNALRDAYRGYVRELQQANRTSEIAVYLRRLEILDPGAVLETGTARAVAAPAPTAAAPRPAEPDKAPPALALLAQNALNPGKKATPAAPLALGKIDDAPAVDPFAEANRAPRDDARALLDRAEREFAARRYDVAGRLYEQAHQADAALAAAARERWAYCKVHAVVEALNRSAVDADRTRELEREVRQALSMSPRLDAFGQRLLRELQQRSGGAPGAGPTAVEVRHTPAQGQGWAVAETTNFRVFHRQPRDFAEKVARAAEATKVTMSRKWFGDDGGTWAPRCDLYLHATGQDYSRATGVPAGSPGHSTLQREGDRVISRRIDLHCDDPNMTVGVLPHETTHVVLAGRFGPHDVPRWADEGMAVLSEPRERIELHLRNLPRHAQERQLFPVGQLVRLNDYPDPRYVGSFYAQSVSLVEYLSAERGPRVFAQFLRDGLNGQGHEAALRQHYGINSFAELETRWRGHALGAPANPQAVAGRAP